MTEYSDIRKMEIHLHSDECISEFIITHGHLQRLLLANGAFLFKLTIKCLTILKSYIHKFTTDTWRNAHLKQKYSLDTASEMSVLSLCI